MGRCIATCIPFEIKIEPYYHYEKYFADGFFDCFTETEKNFYHLKEDLFIANYKDFVLEFSDLIDKKMLLSYHRDSEGKLCHVFIEADDPLINQTTAEGFKDIFSRDNRNALIPFFEEQPPYFLSTTCSQCGDVWLFYSDGGKSYLESYDILRVAERFISKSMKNPLAKAVKFGLYG
jgi:hypothetical protein